MTARQLFAADQGRHNRDWHRNHAERVACYATDVEDALGSAKSLSDHMVGLTARNGVECAV